MATLPITRTSGPTDTPASALETAVRRLAWRRLGTRIAAYIRKHLHKEHAWRGRLELEAMTDHELRDIGLCRMDVLGLSRAEVRFPIEIAGFDLRARESSSARRHNDLGPDPDGQPY